MDNENEGVVGFMEGKGLLGGFKKKEYENLILKGVMWGVSGEEIKEMNEVMIVEEVKGWDIGIVRE